jgi:dienelactone hydrolase
MKAEDFEYNDGDLTCRGYLAFDETRAGERPGVLLIHEAGGLGVHVLERTKMLAELGYVALAADLYGGRKRVEAMEETRTLMDGLRENVATHRARAQAGVDALASLPNVDASRMAAIGFCFGGATVLELARGGALLKGVVSFHELLETKAPAKKGEVTASVLVCNGADDPMVPPDHVAAFEEEMRTAGADWQVINYGGTVHSFTNPWADGSVLPHILYNEQTATRAWTAMQAFFDEVLGRV